MRPPIALLFAPLCLACTAKPAGNQDLSAPDLTALPDLVAGPRDYLVPDLSTATAAGDLAGADLSVTPTPDLRMPDLTAAPQDLAGADLSCPTACNTPPPAECQGNAVVTYMNPGACNGGTCAYSSSMQNCTNGCFQAQCTNKLSYLGDTKGFVSGNDIGLQDSVPKQIVANSQVSVITQTWPPGSVMEIHLFYATDANYTTQKDLVLQYDKMVGNNQQWYAIIPGQAAGTHVWFWVKAVAWDGTFLADPAGGLGHNFEFVSQ